MVQIFNTILETALDSSGNPINTAKLFIYEAGTTTKLTTYSDSALTSANANPLIADSAGRFVTIYGNPDDYKFVLAPANDTDPPASAIQTTDNYTIAATTAFSGGINTSGETEHLVNAQTGTSYTILDGDRAKLVTHSNASAIAVTLPEATSSTFENGWYYDTACIGAGTTTITPTTSTINGAATYVLTTNKTARITSDGTNYQISGVGLADLVDDTSPQLGGFLDPNGNYIGWDKGGDIASASPLVIDTDGNMFDVTGTTNFSAMTVATNRKFTLQFDGILTITDGASIVLPGNANFVTAVGDILECQSTASNTVLVTSITKANGEAVAATGRVLLETQTASDSSNITFSGNIDSTFPSYHVDILVLVPATDSANLLNTVSIDGGSSFISTNYGFHLDQQVMGTGTYNGSSNASASSITMSTGHGTNTGEHRSMRYTMLDPSDATKYKTVTWVSGGYNDNGAGVGETGVGTIPTTSAINAIKFAMSTGNIASAVFKLYGVP